jgi:hypothetical protein
MKRMIWVVLSVVCFSVVPAGRADLVADLANDWSDTSNPDTATFGTWTYREGTTPLPSVSNFTFDGTLPFPVTQPAWAPSNIGGDFLPAALKARSVPSGGYDFQVGDVIVHTTDPANGPSNGPVNFLWTSPIAGTVTISGGVWAAALLAGRDNSWSLFVNGVLVSSGASIDPYTRSNPFLLSNGTGGAAALVQNVTPGSTIDLEIDRTTPLGFLVGVDLTITGTAAVPEPGSIILSGIGISAFMIVTLVRRVRKDCSDGSSSIPVAP